MAPNPRGSFSFGQRFVDEITQDWGGRVMTDLIAVFDAAVKLPSVHTTRQGIAGASYGGYAVDWLIGHTTRFKVAVNHDGVFNLDSMALATEELWFSDSGAGTRRGRRPPASSSRSGRAPLRAEHQGPTLVITNELDFVYRSVRGCTSSRRCVATGCRAKRSSSRTTKPLNSQRWHEEVFDLDQEIPQLTLAARWNWV